MPEGPELHLSSLFINRNCCDLIFSGKVTRNPIHKCAEIDWDEPAYTIRAESRGKELMLHLQTAHEQKNTNVNNEKNSSYEANDNTTKYSTSILFTFGMSGMFELTPADELRKHSHLTFFARADAGDDNKAVALSFVDYRRFGKWYQDANWSEGRGPCVIQEFDAFVNNVAENLNDKAFNKPICEVMLDQRFFSGIGNYLRAEILFRCKVAPFERARSVLKANEEKENSTEELKSQSNEDSNRKKKKGKGTPVNFKVDNDSQDLPCANDIKSEPAFDRENAGVHDVKKELDIKVEKDEKDFKEMQIMWHLFTQKGQEILNLCHTVAMEVVQLGSTKDSLSQMYYGTDNNLTFHDWVQCYSKDGMKNLADHNSRTIWFSGPAGPLVPKEQKSRNKKSSKKTSSKNKETVSDSRDHAKPDRKPMEKKSATGRLTRKKLSIIENSVKENKKRKVKQGKDQKTKAMNGTSTPAKSDSKRKRKIEASKTKTNQVKKRKTDSVNNISKTKHQRITRSSVISH